MSDLLLSICIPTYNRGEILLSTIKSIIADPCFSDRVEIVISDNCSTDNTNELVCNYISTLSENINIRYYRNTRNIKDFNFAKVLEYGKGRYLKLSNDTITFQPGQLGKLLETIEDMSNFQYNLLFCQVRNLPVAIPNRTTYLCNSPKEILSKLSYWTTWIGNFGVWREHFDKLNAINRYADTQLTQVDWIYRMANDRATLLLYDDYYIVQHANKGGYNFYHVFIDNYFFILRKFFPNNICFQIEKRRLFQFFIIPSFIQSLIIKSGNTFDNNGVIRIISKHYWYYPYFLLWPLLWLFYFLYKKIIK